MNRLTARVILTIWISVGVALALRTLIQPENHTVFPILRGGSLHWWSHEPMYVEYKPYDYYRYPPTFAVVVTPLALLGTRLGGILWAWLSLATYGIGLLCFQRHVLPGRWSNPRQASFYLLCLFGGLRGLWNGQSNALVMGLLLLGGTALVRRRDWQAALWLGTAVAVKLTPLAPVLLLAAAFPRRLLGRLTVVLVAASLLPFMTRPPAEVFAQYRGLAEQAHELSGQRWPGFRDAWTVCQVVEHEAEGGTEPVPICHALFSPTYRGVQFAGAVLTLAWCLWQRWRGVSAADQVHRSLAAGLAWLLLLGPATEHATYVLLAPALCWALVQRDLWPEAWRRRLIELASLLILVLGWGVVERTIAGPTWGLVTLPIGCGLFMAWLVGLPEMRPRDPRHYGDIKYPILTRSLRERQYLAHAAG